MKERMNETYSIRSDSCIKRGTKTCRCASVTDGMIMKCSDFLFLFPGSFIIPVPLCCPPPPLFPVSAPGRADFGMIRNETLHLDFNCGVITGLNVQVVAGISRWFQEQSRLRLTAFVGFFCILVQNCFGCDVCHLCGSFIISHHVQVVTEGFRLQTTRDYCLQNESFGCSSYKQKTAYKRTEEQFCYQEWTGGRETKSLMRLKRCHVCWKLLLQLKLHTTCR